MPRVTRQGQTYFSKTYQRFQKAAQPLAGQHDGIPTAGPVMVLLEHVITKPKTGKLDYPRGDVDNFCKGTLDILTKSQRFWLDDNQVVGLAAFKRYAEPNEKAGGRVHWYEIGDEDDSK